MQITEEVIIKRAIAELLAAGYSLSVDDGEETTVVRSTDPAVIFAALCTTDEDFLHTHSGKTQNPNSDAFGWVRLIYGNAEAVISDYTTNLEDDLTATNALAESLQDETKAPAILRAEIVRQFLDEAEAAAKLEPTQRTHYPTWLRSRLDRITP